MYMFLKYKASKTDKIQYTIKSVTKSIFFVPIVNIIVYYFFK